MNLYNLRPLREHKPFSDLEMLLLHFCCLPSLLTLTLKTTGGPRALQTHKPFHRAVLESPFLASQSLVDSLHPKVSLLMVSYSFTCFAWGKCPTPTRRGQKPYQFTPNRCQLSSVKGSVFLNLLQLSTLTQTHLSPVFCCCFSLRGT